MTSLPRPAHRDPTRRSRFRWPIALLLTAVLAAGCDSTLEPFAENDIGPFSVFGYLDLYADTQWVRVTPIRRTTRPDSASFDAVVTLERLGTGRVVTLRDSVFRFFDPGLDAYGYAHNFWTTEPMEPEARYRLVATRSDGAATEATAEIPTPFTLELRFWQTGEPEAKGWVPRRLFAEGDQRLVYGGVLYTVEDGRGDGRPAPPVPEPNPPRMTEPGRWRFDLPGLAWFERLNEPPWVDMLRREAQVVMAGPDWPYEADLSPLDVLIPGRIPTTVENGVGALVGVAARRVPLPFCEPLEPRPDGDDCTTRIDDSSASIAGEVKQCAGPALTELRLTERFPDGGVVVWIWSTDWSGAYRFDGLVPGSDLRLEIDGLPDGGMDIPPLGPGERYEAPRVTLGGC